MVPLIVIFIFQNSAVNSKVQLFMVLKVYSETYIEIKYLGIHR